MCTYVRDAGVCVYVSRAQKWHRRRRQRSGCSTCCVRRMNSRAAITEQSGSDMLTLVKVARAGFAPGTEKTARFCRGQFLQVSVLPAARVRRLQHGAARRAACMHARTRANTHTHTHTHTHVCCTDRQAGRQIQRVTQRRAHTQKRRMRACIHTQE